MSQTVKPKANLFHWHKKPEAHTKSSQDIDNEHRASSQREHSQLLTQDQQIQQLIDNQQYDQNHPRSSMEQEQSEMDLQTQGVINQKQAVQISNDRNHQELDQDSEKEQDLQDPKVTQGQRAYQTVNFTYNPQNIPGQNTSVDKLKQVIDLVDQEQQDIQDDDQGKVLLETQIDMGDDQYSMIQVREGDNPYKVAEQFCTQRRLPSNVVQALYEHISDNLEGLQEVNASDYYKQPKIPRPQTERPKRNQELLSQELTTQENTNQDLLNQKQVKQANKKGNHDNQPQNTEAQQVSSNNASSKGDNQNIQKLAQLRKKLKKRQQYYRMKLAASLKSAKKGEDPNLISQPKQRDVALRLQQYGVTVRERQEAIRKKLMQEELSMCKTYKTSSGSKKLLRQIDTKGSPYDKLYTEWQRRQMKLYNQREKRLQQLDEEEVRDFTGQPKINKPSLRKANSLSSLQERENGSRERQLIWQNLQRRNMDTEQRLQSIRQVQDRLEMKECTFMPKITFTTKQMMERKGEEIRDRQKTFLRMYNQAQVYRDRLEQERERNYSQFTYTPIVNSDRNALKKMDLSVQPTVMELAPGDKSQSKLQHARSLQLYEGALLKKERQKLYQLRIKNGQDPLTGEQMFSPKTNKGILRPYSARSADQENEASAITPRKSTKIPNEIDYNNIQEAEFISKNSKELVSKSYRQQLAEIFKQLDIKGDGKINLQQIQKNIKYETLFQDKQLIDDLKNLAGNQSKQQTSQLNDQNQAQPITGSYLEYFKARSKEITYISEKQFIDQMLKLFEQNPGQLRLYLKTQRLAREIPESMQELTFSPRIGRNSKLMMERIGRSAQPAYHKLYDYHKIKRDNLRRLGKEQQSIDLTECTFQPNLPKKSPEYLKKLLEPVGLSGYSPDLPRNPDAIKHLTQMVDQQEAQLRKSLNQIDKNIHDKYYQPKQVQNR